MTKGPPFAESSPLLRGASKTKSPSNSSHYGDVSLPAPTHQVELVFGMLSTLSRGMRVRQCSLVASCHTVWVFVTEWREARRTAVTASRGGGMCVTFKQWHVVLMNM